MAAVLVLNLSSSEYPEESQEGPGEGGQQVEDDAHLGDVLQGWKYEEKLTPSPLTAGTERRDSLGLTSSGLQNRS